MERENVTVDRRHDRRELLEEEIRRLLDMTRASPRSYRGLSGQDRFHIYAMACGSGFRASALASLTPESFDLDGPMPTVTLPARHSKNRKTKIQPLPADLVELLREYLPGKPAGIPIWGGTWVRDGRGAEMLRGDLQTANIPYVVEGPDGPLYADFHSLRHSYLTLGGRAGHRATDAARTGRAFDPGVDGPLFASAAARFGWCCREVAELPSCGKDKSAGYRNRRIKQRTGGQRPTLLRSAATRRCGTLLWELRDSNDFC
jgi:integrase